MKNPLPGWAEEVLEKREKIEAILGLPIGQLYACGHFGCVFQSTPPWSVKLTRDPTEGPMWAQLAAFVRDNNYGTDGIARVRDIVRLHPDIRFRRREWPVHAVVREEIAPLWEDNHLLLTPYSAERLRTKRRHVYRPYESAEVREFAELLSGLTAYKEAATRWHDAERFKRLQRKQEAQAAAEHRMMAATGLMSGPIGGYIGETLTVLADDGIYLRDVHHANIGWRLHSRIGDEDDLPETLIIFDPGHTPTGTELVIREATPNR